MTQPSSTKMIRTTFSNCFHIIKRRRLITAELQQVHLPVGRHFQVQAAHRQRVETLLVLKCSRSIFTSWWCGRRTQVLTTKMYTFSTTDSRQIHWVELSPLWSRSAAGLLTWLENLHSSRFLLQSHDEKRPDHEVAVKPTLVAAAAAAHREHRSAKRVSRG